MRLNPDPFQKIQSGQKNIELRINDEKRQTIKPGDEILFINREDNRTILTKVIGLCWFQDFATLIPVVGWKACGFDRECTSEQYDKGMETFYPKEEIKKYGALGIAIQLVLEI
jgi:ASC-1-like (ASCH) protein